jgi:hypothetical protein
MRAEVSGAPDNPPASAAQALWWPPVKIAGRWLAPYLAQRHDELERDPTGLVVEAEIPMPVRSRALIGRERDGHHGVAPVGGPAPRER